MIMKSMEVLTINLSTTTEWKLCTIDTMKANPNPRGRVKVSGECSYPLSSVEPDIIILVLAVAVLLFWATNM